VQLAQRLLRENPRAAKTFNIYTPYPGTALYRMAVELGHEGAAAPRGLVAHELPVCPEGISVDTFPAQETDRRARLPPDVLARASSSRRRTLREGVAQALPARGAIPLKNMDAASPSRPTVVRALGLFGRQD